MNYNLINAWNAGNPVGAYSYNLFGNQVSYTPDGVVFTNYTYRPDGLRHSIDDKVHVWDGANIVADVEGNEIVVYIRGVNLIYADDGNKTYYHFNAHGDVVVLTNEGGNKTKSYSYNAFGVEHNESTLDDNPFRYCGEYYDKETKNIYLRARYYNPEQGRFTQEDPIRDGYNWYSYCYQNPLSYIDPNGMAAMDCLDFDDDPADGVDVISFGFCGGGGGGQVSPIISPYDSTAYNSYSIRSNTARYDVSLGGYYSGGISSATANPGYYIIPEAQTVTDDMAVSTQTDKLKDQTVTKNAGSKKTYKPPVGGGGVTDTIKIGNKTVTFGHGGRHKLPSNIDIDTINQLIAEDVVNQPPVYKNVGKGFISLSDVTIEYHYRNLNYPVVINVGTYFPVKNGLNGIFPISLS